MSHALTSRHGRILNLLRIKHSNKGERTALDFERVCARSGELLHRAADELPVKNRYAGIVAYNNSRAMRS